MVEVEIRFKTNELAANKLRELAEEKSSSEETDYYYKFGKDDVRSFIIRFRYKDGKKILTFKGSSVLDTDTAWQEWEQEIKDPDVLRNLLKSNGFEEFLVIKKHRTKFSYEDFEINLDKIENLGDYIEIELIGEDASALRERVITFGIEKLGLDSGDLIEKGYVKLMLGE